MRQIVQEIGTGKTAVVDVPAPNVPERGLSVRTRCSLISAGTERMLVEFSRAGWIDRARQQPERVRQVIDKVRSDGLAATVDAVRSQLDRELPLGYCNVGVVMDVGSSSRGFAVGERVVSNGPHAEVVAVQQNLCAAIPDQVTDEQAAFTVLAAVGLQGIRLADPTIGETFAVIGLGLIGLLTVQMLRANGCRVVAVDPDPNKTALAQRFGAHVPQSTDASDTVALANEFSRGRGVDGVLITASTASDSPVSQAARMCRKRGRIVLVGVTGLKLNRAEFYEKELSFSVSCSYGPGRYDPNYEAGGQDYPEGFVRWTAQRNFEAVLDMLAADTIDVAPLISHRYSLDDAADAYDMLTESSDYLGVVLTYPQIDAPAVDASTVHVTPVGESATQSSGNPTVAAIGAGNYARRILLPAVVEAGAELVGIASDGGQSAASAARKFGAREATTDAPALIASDAVNTVVVATRHDSHARYVCEAIAAGKNVFVEKPLALSHREIDEISAAWTNHEADSRPRVMVGFNRRFAPLIVRMKSLLDSIAAPKTFIATVNAGELPQDHWTQDAARGGGRIVGEACHFIDLLRFLAGSKIVHFDVITIAADVGTTDDKATMSLRFENGSIGTIHYFANGHRSFPKERIEAFADGRVLQLDNFRRLSGFGWGSFKRTGGWRQDKGQQACMAQFLEAIRTGAAAPIAFEELIEVSRTVVDIAAAARSQPL